MFAPRNDQRASTNPLRDPSTDEMIAAGMTIWNERRIAGHSVVHAAFQFSSVHSCGSAQARVGAASPGALKLVTSST